MPFLGKVPSQLVDSDVDIDGGSIDGVSIGSVTANAGAFTNLTATGTLTLPDDGISGDDVNGGTISNFASTGIDDNATSTALTVTDSGIAATLTTAAQPNVTSLGTLSALAVTGDLTVDTDTLYVDSTNNRVGIGDITPAEKLTVEGNVRINKQPTATNGITWDLNTTNFGSIKMDGTENMLFDVDKSTADFIFGRGSSEYVRFANTGRVGIGEDDPQSRLVVSGVAGADSRIHVSSSSAGESTFDGSGSGLLLTARNMNTSSRFTPAIQFGSTDTGFIATNPKVGAAINGIAAETYSSDDDSGMHLGFYTTPSNNGATQATLERMRVDNYGNVLIGATSSPRARLHVSDNSDIDMDSLASGHLHLDGNSYGFGIALNTDGAQIYTNSASRDLIFGVNESETMRLTPSRLGLNNNAPSRTLDIGDGTSVANVGIRSNSQPNILFSNSSGTVGYIGTTLWNTGSGSDNELSIRSEGDLTFCSANSERIRIDSAGRMIHHSGTSNERKKEYLVFTFTRSSTATLDIVLQDGGCFFIRVGTAHPLYTGTAYAWEYFISHKASSGNVATAQMSKDATSVSFDQSSVTTSGGTLSISFPTGTSTVGTSVHSDIFVEMTGQYTSVSLA
jgi:hypothetical protein